MPNFILAMPAGIEIKLLTMGTHRHNRTVFFPLLLNQSQALKTSSFLNRRIFPILPSSIFASKSTESNLPIL